LNVYVYENGENILLHDKNYFLDKQNINVESNFIRFYIRPQAKNGVGMTE